MRSVAKGQMSSVLSFEIEPVWIEVLIRIAIGFRHQESDPSAFRQVSDGFGEIAELGLRGSREA